MKIKEVYFRFLKLFDKHINLIVINLYLYIFNKSFLLCVSIEH